MNIDIQEQKAKLEAERGKLEEELSHIADKDDRGVWQANQRETNDTEADRQVAAEALSEFEGNLSLVQSLKDQLEDVEEALSNITTNHYGFCVVCGEKISVERLIANPAAKTCQTHMQSQS